MENVDEIYEKIEKLEEKLEILVLEGTSNRFTKPVEEEIAELRMTILKG